MTLPNDKLIGQLAEACVVLGLVPPVRMDDVKSRYRKLAKLYHPDVGQRKNEEDFSRITRAYELIEQNPEILASATITLGGKDPGGRLTALINELRETKTRAVNAESAARRLAEEANATRHYYNATKRKGRSWIIALLACGAGITLGFIAGTVWTYKSPIGLFQDNLPLEITLAPFAATATEDGTTEPLALHSNGISAKAIMNNAKIRVELTDGKADLEMQSTPTLVLQNPPAGVPSLTRTGMVTDLYNAP